MIGSGLEIDSRSTEKRLKIDSWFVAPDVFGTGGVVGERQRQYSKQLLEAPF